MTIYPYETQLVLNDDGSKVLVTNAQVTIYDPADSGLSAPLALTDDRGLPLANPVMVTPQGFLPAFKATVPQIMWVGNGYFGFISSHKGMLDQATNAATQAANAATDAMNAKAAAEAAALSATAPTDASIDAGIARANAVAAWKANTAYLLGQYVVNPSGSLAKALQAHTSTSTYDATKWQVTASGSGSGTGSGTARVVQDPATGTIPPRPTSDPNVLVFWICWTEPARVTSGTGGAYPNDIWFKRSAP